MDETDDSTRRMSLWSAAQWMIAGATLLRVIYLVWLSPWELVGDEAYYWEWSRHLDWCYYEKGPGLAYLIWPFVKVLGVHEYAVRMPMALLWGVSAWVVGRMAISVARGDERAGFWSVALFLILPAFGSNAQICTQDGPLILVWALLTFSGLRLIRNWEAGSARVMDWCWAAMAMGVGFLLKQSILLFGLGLVVYVAVRRRQLKWSWRLLGQVGVGCLVFLIFTLPMLVWNARHDWPTLAHTLGHLGAGGDLDAEKPKGNFFLWFAALVGSQIGVVGPAAIGLMGWAVARAIRMRREDKGMWVARLWLICASVPSILFFVLLSFHKPVIGSWPFPSFVPLVALVGEMAIGEMARYGREVRGWKLLAKPRPKRGYLRKAPETRFSALWNLTVMYGVVGCLLLAFPHVLEYVPFIGGTIRSSVTKRFSGQREHAKQLASAIEQVRRESGGEPVVMARYYMVAALDAFYLPGHPVVYCAGTLFGKRATAFDYFEDARLTDAKLKGRCAVLDGQLTAPWGDVLKFEKIEVMNGRPFLKGTGYGGVRATLRPTTRGVLESDHE